MNQIITNLAGHWKTDDDLVFVYLRGMLSRDGILSHGYKLVENKFRGPLDPSFFIDLWTFKPERRPQEWMALRFNYKQIERTLRKRLQQEAKKKEGLKVFQEEMAKAQYEQGKKP